jgi:MFS family permease
MFVSLVGTWIQLVAQSWLVFQLTHSAFLLGLVGFLSAIPIFLFSLFGGVLADRFDKRNILIFTQTAFMLLAFLLAVLTQLELISASQIMLIALLNGIIMAFDAPSRQAMVVELVGKENLANAIALNSVAFNSSRIIGPALAGIFVAVIGMSGCFYLNGISFFAVLFALFLLKVERQPKQLPGGHSAWRSLQEGIGFVKNNRLVLALVLLVAMISLFGISYVILMPLVANDILKVGVKGLGVLMSASGFGALAGALFLARLGDFSYKGKLLAVSSLVFSFALVLFSLSKAYLLSIISLIFIGGTTVIAVAIVNTILQTKVPDNFRGRVMSVFMLTFAGMTPFGNLIAGSLAQARGVCFALQFSGIICTTFFSLIYIAYPKIRKL